MKHKKAILGGLIWLAIIVIISALFSGAKLNRKTYQLFRYLTTPSQVINVEAENMVEGEKVMSVINGQLSTIGYIKSTGKDQDGNNIAVLVLDPEYPLLTKKSTFAVVNARGDMNWAIKTILPDHKLDLIKLELIQFRKDNQEQLTRLTGLVAKDLSEEAITTLNQNLSKSYTKHEPELSKILDKHGQNLKRDLIPIIKEQLGPSAKEKLKPLLTVIGKELWDALPVWGFTWRAVIDKVPGTKKDRTQKEFDKFVEEKAIPIVSDHEKEFVKVAEDLFIQASKDKKIRKELALLGKKLVNDPEFKNLINIILQEALIEPFKSENLIKRLMENEKLKSEFEELTRAFDPVLKEITRIIIKNDNGQIEDDLVQAMRRVFFERNDRVLIIKLDEKSEKVKPDYLFTAETE